MSPVEEAAMIAASCRSWTEKVREATEPVWIAATLMLLAERLEEIDRLLSRGRR